MPTCVTAEGIAEEVCLGTHLLAGQHMTCSLGKRGCRWQHVGFELWLLLYYLGFELRPLKLQVHGGQWRGSKAGLAWPCVSITQEITVPILLDSALQMILPLAPTPLTCKGWRSILKVEIIPTYIVRQVSCIPSFSEAWHCGSSGKILKMKLGTHVTLESTSKI